jgi:flagellar hook-associated protein 1
MDLVSSLSMATSGLNAIQYELAVTSDNVSNSGTTGYVSESASVSAAIAGSIGTGVAIGKTHLSVNNALQTALYGQNAQVAALTATSNSLSAVSAVQGSTAANAGSTNTLSDELGNVETALTTLTATPQESSSQSAVYSAAQSLTTSIQTLSATYTTQRQSAEDSVVSTVSSINSDLTQIGSLSQQIMTVTAAGGSTADLENQRLEAMSSLSSEVSVTFSTTSNGDMIVRTADGTELPTRPDQMGVSDSTVTLPSSTWPLSTSDTVVTSSMSYQADDSSSQIPGIMLNGQDITSHLTGGTLGANITLRDSTYPTMQAQLDSFSYTLASRFSNAGMTLFTDAAGDDVSGESATAITGLSSQLTVNTSALPTSVTTDGDTTAISTILSTTFGSASADVSGTLEAPSTGLGPMGNLSTGYSGAQGLGALATTLTSEQGAVIGDASDNLTSATSVQTTLQTSVTNVSGVNVDDQMSTVVTLENAYAANAKVITAVQSMFTALLDAVQ